MEAAAWTKDIRSLDSEDWKSTPAGTGVSNRTLNHAVVAVKICWSGAVEYDLVPVNLLAKVQKLHADGRWRVITAEEFCTQQQRGCQHERAGLGRLGGY
jgi:hypothetical protein